MYFLYSPTAENPPRMDPSDFTDIPRSPLKKERSPDTEMIIPHFTMISTGLLSTML